MSDFNEPAIPPWMTSRADQQMARLAESVPHVLLHTPGLHAVFLLPLVSPPEEGEDSFDTWSRTCDHCLRFVPDGANFYTGSISTPYYESLVKIIFGLCETCNEELEHGA